MSLGFRQPKILVSCHPGWIFGSRL